MVGKSPIAKSILECVYAGGCVSKSALLCMPYSYQNISFHIKKLLDNGWLQLYGRGRKKRYRLLPIAVDFLFEKDELRYAAYDTLLNRVRTDERAMNIGDSAVLFKLSEFGANINDKPLLPANTSYMKDGAFYTTEIYHNYYFDPDNNCLRHDSPVNCFYTAREIKAFAEKRSASGTNDIQYSRLTGALFTPDRIYRVYHTRDVALDFRPTGEANAEALIHEMFTGYVPSEEIGTIVLGYQHTAAEKIIRQSLDADRLKMARLHGGIQQRLNGSNLSSHLIYFPIKKESTLSLHFMSYPGWLEWLNNYIATSLFPDLNRANSGFFVGNYDGYNLFNGLYMNLTQLSVILGNLQSREGQKVALLCFDWQQKFYEKLLLEYTSRNNCFEIYELSAKDFKQIVKTHDNFWRGKDIK